MKRKFLLFVCAVLGILQANAYTTANLVSDGWSLAPNFSSNKDYVYVFVDAGASTCVLASNPSNIGGRPVYLTLQDPTTAPGIVWTIESRNDGYALRNIESQYYYNSGNAGWNNYMGDKDYSTGSFTFISNSTKYDIQSVTTSYYVGPWEYQNATAYNGEEAAANKDNTLSPGTEPGPSPGFFIYQMNKATYALKYLQNCPNLTAPVDVSFLIENPTIYQANNNNQMPAGWGDYDVNSNVRTTDGADTDTKLKIWVSSGKGKGDYFSTIGNLPNGQYRITAGIRGNSGDASKFKAYIYQSSTDTRAESSSAPNGSMEDRTTDYLTINSGTANIGVHTTSTVGTTTLEADNFRLQVNPYLSTMATALSFPGSTSLTAGVWYYYDIPADNRYDFTSSAAATIYYTQAADPLLDASTSSEAFTTGQTKDISLSAGRVYFKASDATTLSIIFRYNVGSATLSNADGSYTQNSTFSVTFPDAATNDPNASVAFVPSSMATVNGNEVALSSVTNGFSLDLGSLTANTDYRIVIPAGVYGYAGESMNAAIDVTIHTPAAFDGYYFLRSSAGKYVSRGGNYNSRAVLDEFGLPLSISTSSTGITQFTYVDNGGKLFLNGSGEAYTDDTTAPDWTVQATEGGFYLVHANEGTYKDKKLNSDINNRLFADDSGIVLVFEPVSEHNTYMEALKDAQAATAATAAGIGAVSTKTALDSWLEANYNANSVSVDAVSFTEKWDGNASAEWGAGKDMYTKTISSLPAGLYKLTVNAYYRINGSATAAEGARGNVYLYGGTAKTQLYSIHDFPATEGTYSSYQRDAYGDYPDDATSGNVATTSGYLTELYVYHAGGDFTYGIHQPSRFSNKQWFGYQNFTLTRYEQTEVTMKTFKAGSYGTFIAPFDVTISSGVTASKVTGHVENLLTLEDLTTTIPKNTPVVVYSDDIINETFKGKDGSNGVTSYSEGLLTGIYTAAAIAEGNYVLQTNGGVQGFYQVGAGGLTGVPYRAYLNSSALGVKAFFFGNDADGIDSVQGLGFKVQDSEIFNLAGQKMSKLQKGVNIVNGKKVLVK